MADTKPGDKVSITYERNGQSNKIEATLGEEKSWDWGSWNNLGQDIQNLAFSVTKKEACLGVYTEATSSGSAEGALISDFTEESAAKEINLTKGDIITSVNGALVKGHDDLWKEIAKFKAGDKVKIDYIRNGVKNTVEATLKGCRDHENQIIINDTDETGDNQSRKFFLWNWGTNEEKQIREKRIIPIHKGEGDSPINNADQNTVATADRNLQLKSFTAFPNPTMGQVTVEFKAEPVATVVSLFDQSGRQLFREELNAFSGDYSQQFDLSEHTKGTIRIQVEQKQKVFSEQIVVN
jgi:membrane-associated protease RseP (regulator of RpoE activity)